MIFCVLPVVGCNEKNEKKTVSLNWIIINVKHILKWAIQQEKEFLEQLVRLGVQLLFKTACNYTRVYEYVLALSTG